MNTGARRFSGFVILSGIGWVMDTAVYIALVALGARVLVAGIIGGLCGASFTFITSARLIFNGRAGPIGPKLAAYLGYSLALILAAAWAIEQVFDGLASWTRHWNVIAPPFLLAFAAKCVVTPLLLATNFAVARTMLHRAPAVEGRHG